MIWPSITQTELNEKMDKILGKPQPLAFRLNLLVKRYRAWRHTRKWEYGICGNNDRPARRNRKNGNVQFVLWKAGEQGHAVDYWHDFDCSWWDTFKSNA